MRARTILIAASAAVVALALALALWPAGDDEAGAMPSAPAVTRPLVRPVVTLRDGATARVEGELAELRAEVARLGEAPAPAPKEELTPDEQQARDERRILAKTFAADTRDPSWSPQTERALRDAFAAAALPGARLAEVSCGSTLCRYTVAFDSIEQRDEGAGALFGLPQWDSNGFGNLAPDDPLRYVVYASRDPETLPIAP